MKGVLSLFGLGKKVRGARPHEVGRDGERRAARFLERRGMRVVETNVVLDAGEIDLVAIDRGTVVVVEVKTCTTGTGIPAAALVTPEKGLRLQKLAAEYRSLRSLGDLPLRIDLLLSTVSGGSFAVEHLRNVFPA